MNTAKRMLRAFTRSAGIPSGRAYSHGNRRKYTGDELREIRARNGIGRRHNGEDRHAPNVDAWIRRNWQVNAMYIKWLNAHGK